MAVEETTAEVFVPYHSYLEWPAMSKVYGRHNFFGCEFVIAWGAGATLDFDVGVDIAEVRAYHCNWPLYTQSAS